jgi:hypothetical protein
MQWLDYVAELFLINTVLKSYLIIALANYVIRN